MIPGRDPGFSGLRLDTLSLNVTIFGAKFLFHRVVSFGYDDGFMSKNQDGPGKMVDEAVDAIPRNEATAGGGKHFVITESWLRFKVRVEASARSPMHLHITGNGSVAGFAYPMNLEKFFFIPEASGQGLYKFGDTIIVHKIPFDVDDSEDPSEWG